MCGQKTQHKKTTQDQDSYRNKTNFLLSTISKARKTRVRATGGLEAVTALASWHQKLKSFKFLTKVEHRNNLKVETVLWIIRGVAVYWLWD